MDKATMDKWVADLAAKRVTTDAFSAAMQADLEAARSGVSGPISVTTYSFAGRNGAAVPMIGFEAGGKPIFGKNLSPSLAKLVLDNAEAIKAALAVIASGAPLPDRTIVKKGKGGPKVAA